MFIEACDLFRLHPVRTMADFEEAKAAFEGTIISACAESSDSGKKRARNERAASHGVTRIIQPGELVRTSHGAQPAL